MKNVRALRFVPDNAEKASCPVTITDRSVSISGTGRCDDDSLVSYYLEEMARIRKVGKIAGLVPVYIQVALKSGEDVQTFNFS